MLSSESCKRIPPLVDLANGFPRAQAPRRSPSAAAAAAIMSGKQKKKALQAKRERKKGSADEDWSAELPPAAED